jgi:hypothetical protein
MISSLSKNWGSGFRVQGSRFNSLIVKYWYFVAKFFPHTKKWTR